MSIWQQISSAFWSPSIWLPRNMTWPDLLPDSASKDMYPDCRDLLWSLPLTVILFAIRYCCEKYMFNAFGQWLGIKDECSSERLTPNRILEAAYAKCNRLDEKTLLGLTKQADTMTRREIERWWRLRQAQDKPTTIDKFCVSSWRCLYHTFIFLLGLVVMWDKPWLWNDELSLLGYPHHPIDSGLKFYYMLSLSILICQFFEARRNDFWMMFAHHVIAILLISLAWIIHLHRVGALVFFYHELADIILAAGNSAKYAKYHRLFDAMAPVFVVAWIVTRMMMFPRCVYIAVLLAIEESETAALVPCIIVFLLVLLQCMHIVWTYMIYKTVYNPLKAGAVKKDERSNSDRDENCGKSGTG